MATIPPHSSGAKTLEELAASKSMELLLQSEDSDAEFANLGPIQQELLLKHFFEDYKRLRNRDERLQKAMNKIPHTDQFVNQIPVDIVEEHWLRGLSSDEVHQFIPKEAQKSETETETGPGHGPDRVQDDRRINQASLRFRYVRNFRRRLRISIPRVVWSLSTVRAHSIYSDFKLGLGSEGQITVQGRVSSSLLLYRILDVFGLPPEDYSPYNSVKTVWAVAFYHRDGSSLSIWDLGGVIQGSFAGSNEAGEDSLKLINFLTSGQPWTLQAE